MLVTQGSALSFVPYFARYPYETYVAPREPHASIADLSRDELGDFADVLSETLVRLDNLWRMSFPYVMVLHQAPTDGADHRGFHFHIQVHPPLRKPGLLKYLAGPGDRRRQLPERHGARGQGSRAACRQQRPLQDGSTMTRFVALSAAKSLHVPLSLRAQRRACTCLLSFRAPPRPTGTRE